MAASNPTVSKPNPVTMSNMGQNGDQEFVFACRGRPFSVLTAPQFPTPTFTMVDYNLVRDLKLRLTNLQCTKMIYGGQKLRILGTISTSVQCISEGSTAGNLHFKAHVIQDLYQLFDTHSIAGIKLSQKLIGPPYKLHDEISTEPTKTKTKKRKKSKTKEESTSDDDAASESPPPARCASQPSSLGPLPPKVQGRWIQHGCYQGWHPEHGYGRPDVLRVYYEDRATGQMQHTAPSEWDSDGSFHSVSSMRSTWENSSECSDADEYGDVYTNLSSVRYNDTGPDTPHVSDELPGLSNTTTQADTTTYGKGQLNMMRQAWIHKLNTGQDIPTHLKPIPVPHGPEWCDRNCAAAQYCGATVGPQCGYYDEMLPDDFCPCSIRCQGQWCSCMRKYPGRDLMS